MKTNQLLIIFSVFFSLVSCTNKNETPVEVSSKDPIEVGKSKKMEAVYYSIPSPMETTIILKKNYPKFSSDFLFPNIDIHKVHDNQTIALVLGLISTDLNYAMLSEKRLETNRLINQVIEIAQILHLDGIVNTSIKERVEKNLNNKDSMQIIIGNTFWEIENKLKADHKEKLSALIVAGGWAEGLYLACNMSDYDSKNKPLQKMIADQKIVHENLIELISDFTYDEIIEENFITHIINMKEIFGNIKKIEIEKNPSVEKENFDEIVIGNYFNLKFEKEDINEIHQSINNLRQTILTQLL